MDIRTKLVFALVAVSLGSMLALGAFAYTAARDMLRESAVRQIEGLAETKKQDLENVVVAWRDRVDLIASRTQLRLSLREYSATRDPLEQQRIERILGDAVDSVPAVRGLTVLDAQGLDVASVGEPTEAVTPPVDAGPDEGGSLRTSPVVYAGLDWGQGRSPSVQLVTKMWLQDRVVGSLRARLDARQVTDVAGDTTGLGASGETLIARPTSDGGAFILTPRRHEAVGATRRVAPSDRSDPVLRATSGEESIFLESALDYRGAAIWAATRYLDELGWGIVVKMDRAELLAPIDQLRETIWKLSLSLSAFGIVAGTLMGLYFARPIRELADVAGRIADGDLALRAENDSEDEIGQLATAFNRMAEELIDTNRGLRDQLEARTPPPGEQAH